MSGKNRRKSNFEIVQSFLPLFKPLSLTDDKYSSALSVTFVNRGMVLLVMNTSQQASSFKAALRVLKPGPLKNNLM